MMNVAVDIDDISLSNGFAYADEEVIEVAPTPATKKKWARSSNYSVDEDEALVINLAPELYVTCQASCALLQLILINSGKE
jgi:hypothetical protein